MKALLRSLVVGIGIIVIISAIAMVIYYYVDFRPYRSQIEGIIKDAHPLHINPPEVVYDLAVISEGKSRIKSYVAQRLLNKFGKDKVRMMFWHPKYALWDFLIGLHFNEKDIFTLWCQLAPYKEGNGLNESANYHYKRDLNKLTIEEVASIIAIVEAPSFYETHPEELKERSKILLRLGIRGQVFD